MATKRLTTRGIRTAEAIRDRETFTTSGALSADRVKPGSHHGAGLLSSGERDLYFSTTDIDYIVWSYATPIAWHSESAGWHRVAQRFSATTTKHQGNLYLVGS